MYGPGQRIAAWPRTSLKPYEPVVRVAPPGIQAITRNTHGIHRTTPAGQTPVEMDRSLFYCCESLL